MSEIDPARPGGSARSLVGRYALLRLLGQGGMGAVWQAHDTLLDRDVAVKEIRLPLLAGSSVEVRDMLVARAIREARAAARLRHPGIVTVHDVVTEDDRPWIVMELVRGRSLADVIREQNLLPVGRAAEIGSHVLEALRAAHRQGVLHRDVKPANILLDDDRVVLTDFGIAAVDGATALTATGQLVGSPSYLAPERINGEPATAAADLWGLGVTLYVAVTGRSPFEREDTAGTLAAVLTSHPEPPAHAGLLWPAIKGMLAKDPGERLTADQAAPLLAAVTRAPDRQPEKQRRRFRPAPGPLPDTAVAPSPTVAAPTAPQIAVGDGPTVAAPPAVSPASPAPEPAGVVTVPRRTAVLAGAVLAVTVLVTALGVHIAVRDDDGAVAAPTSPSSTPATASPAVPSAPVSAPPSDPPGVDGCLLGTWRVTEHRIWGEVSGSRVLYTGGAGAVTTYEMNRTNRTDYTKSQPLTAKHRGDTWSVTYRGVVTERYNAADQLITATGTKSTVVTTLRRNGKVNATEKTVFVPEPATYRCTGDDLNLYSAQGDFSTALTRITGS